MKKLLLNILFFMCLIFSFSLNAKAECSYQERTELLNEAKNVEIFFEVAERKENTTIVNPSTGESSVKEKTITYLNMTFANISENIYLFVANKSTGEEFVLTSQDLINNKYTYEINDISNIVNYEVIVKSNLDNCYLNQVYTKTYKKPKYNSVSDYSICANELLENNEYCKRFVDTEFGKTDVEIVEYLNSILEKKEEENKVLKVTFLELLKIYWYIPTIIVGVIFIVLITILIIKKRGELK